LPERQHFLRRVGEREQLARGLVHAHVGGLGRQQHGAQQLEHRGVFEFGHGVRVAAFRVAKNDSIAAGVMQAGAGEG